MLKNIILVLALSSLTLAQEDSVSLPVILSSPSDECRLFESNCFLTLKQSNGCTATPLILCASRSCSCDAFNAIIPPPSPQQVELWNATRMVEAPLFPVFNPTLVNPQNDRPSDVPNDIVEEKAEETALQGEFTSGSVIGGVKSDGSQAEADVVPVKNAAVHRYCVLNSVLILVSFMISVIM